MVGVDHGVVLSDMARPVAE